MTQFTIPLPDSISPSDARLCLALKLYEVGTLSLGQAAELSGQPKRQFMRELHRQGGRAFNQDEDELSGDLLNA